MTPVEIVLSSSAFSFDANEVRSVSFSRWMPRRMERKQQRGGCAPVKLRLAFSQSRVFL